MQTMQFFSNKGQEFCKRKCRKGRNSTIGKKIDSLQPHTSDKSTRIEISVGIASLVERVYSKKKKKAEQNGSSATFLGDRRGEASHYSATERERGSGPSLASQG